MKKQLFSLINILLYSVSIFSQSKQLPVKEYQPWQLDHPAIDYKYTYFEPDFVTDSSDGYNCFLDTPIRLNHFDDKYLYYAFAARTDFDVEGYFLTKFNVETGKEEWRRAINMRNQENREMPVALKVENESILVASLEKRNDNYLPLQLAFYALNSNSGLIIRRFDSMNGSLLSQIKSQDSIYSYGIFPFGDKYSVTKYINNELLFIGNEYSPGNAQTRFIHIDTSHLSIRSQSIYHQIKPKRYVFNKNYSHDYNYSNGLYAYDYDFENTTKLANFDLFGNIRFEVLCDTSGRFTNGLNILFVNNDLLLLNGIIDENPFEIPRDFYFVYDQNLNLLSKFESPYRENGERIIDVFSTNNKEYIYFSTISKTTDFEDGFGYTCLYKYNTLIKQSEQIYKFYFTDSLRYAFAADFVELADKFVVMFMESSLYFKEEAGTYFPDPDARAYSIIKFDKSKLINAQQELYRPNFNYFPNPVSNVLWLDCDPCPSSIIIYNSLGQMIYQGNINDKQIDVSHLMPGMYFITSVMDDSQFVTNKFIRISD